MLKTPRKSVSYHIIWFLHRQISYLFHKHKLYIHLTGLLAVSQEEVVVKRTLRAWRVLKCLIWAGGQGADNSPITGTVLSWINAHFKWWSQMKTCNITGFPRGLSIKKLWRICGLFLFSTVFERGQFWIPKLLPHVFISSITVSVQNKATRRIDYNRHDPPRVSVEC